MKTLTKLVCAAALATTISAVGSASAGPGPNRKVMDRFFAVVDAKQADKLGEVEAEDIDMVTPMGPVGGSAGHKQLLIGFATAFPNFKHVTTRCIESKDLISCEGVFIGDHTGPMMLPNGKSIPATNKHVEFGYAGFARIKRGKVVELKVYFDTATMMAQLGVVK